MNKISGISIQIFLIILSFQLISDKGFSQSQDSVRIDKISIEKNWMTWDLIVKSELEFKEGETVSYGIIDTSIQKIWNIGNFSDVKYEIIKGADGNTLQITALDALVLYPLITVDHSSEEEYMYRLGYGDENFLGSNSELKIVWQKEPIGTSWDFRIKLPRQLMYKNMSLTAGYVSGTMVERIQEREIIRNITSNKVSSVNYHPILLSPYKKSEFYVSIGNPWHLDYKYTFSPNLDMRFIHHSSNLGLLSEEDWSYLVHLPPYEHKILQLSLNESVGTVNKKRHRLNGYNIGSSLGIGLGLDRNSPNYTSITFYGQYHKTYGPILQFSSKLNTGFTNADFPYTYIKGSSDVLGLRSGEIYGKAYYSAYLGAHCTWINNKWITLENAYFLNFGRGAETSLELLIKKPYFAVGSSFLFRTPMTSFIEFKFTFMYAGPGTEWFKFNM